MTDVSDTTGLLGSVYKMYHASNPDIIYIGSTTTSLTQRLSMHKIKARGHPERKVYQYMNALGLDDIRIELLDQVMFQTTQQLHIIEDEWMRRLSPTLNSINAILDVEKRKENAKELNKQYRIKNVNKHRCDICNYHTHNKSNLTKHQNTQRHRDNIAAAS
jgi:hypothetical protein